MAMVPDLKGRFLMRYFVVVNQKFIVAVDSTSNGGAEHVVLDRFDGVVGAQAFGPKDVRTETFAHFMATCDTVSIDELETMMARYDSVKARLVEAENEYDRLIALREKINRELEDAGIARSDARGAYRAVAVSVGNLREV